MHSQKQVSTTASSAPRRNARPRLAGSLLRRVRRVRTQTSGAPPDTRTGAERPSRAGGRPCPPERLKRPGSNHRKSTVPGTSLGWNAPRIRPEHLLEPQTLTGTGLVLKKADTYRQRGSAWARLRCLCLQVTEARQGDLGGAAPNQPENQVLQGPEPRSRTNRTQKKERRERPALARLASVPTIRSRRRCAQNPAVRTA